MIVTSTVPVRAHSDVDRSGQLEQGHLNATGSIRNHQLLNEPDSVLTPEGLGTSYIHSLPHASGVLIL